MNISFSIFVACCLALPSASEIQVESDFEGGNVIVNKIVGDDVYLQPDQRESSSPWFYWNFWVKGAEGRTVTFHFPDQSKMSSRGSAFSSDNGKTWGWLGSRSVKGKTFRYKFSKDDRQVQFCTAVPYTQKNLDQFLKKHKKNPHLKIETLCQSKKKRRVVRLHLGQIQGEPKFRMVLTCRHHACEMMASYVLEGIMESILSDSEDGKWFQKHVEILVIPFMDHDGVIDGDQGKNRKPRDHNRDYSGKSIHREVAALRQFLPKWSQGKLRFALDMHNPGITKSQYNEIIYLVQDGSPHRERINQFAKTLESNCKGTLPYAAKETLQYGIGWNTARNYTAGLNSSRWMGMQQGIRFASTIEIPYANVKEKAVTPKTARQFGTDLVKAIRLFLENDGAVQ